MKIIAFNGSGGLCCSSLYLHGTWVDEGFYGPVRSAS